MLFGFSCAIGRKSIAALFSFFSVMTLSVSAASAADDLKKEMTAAAASVRPALIRIHAISADYRQGRQLRVESAGSGVIISPDGYAVTNHHVASEAEKLVCTLADKREVDAKLIGTDPLADIAVLKLESPDNKPFPYAEFGDSSKLEVGDRVYAMGSPFAISQSVTMGIVSNVEMIMPDMFSSQGLLLDGEDVGSIVRWIGHDALIEPGNSGGPLVDRDGKIVGINEISIGLAGAIPSNLAKDVAEQLKTTGKVVRSWLGIEVQPMLKSSAVQEGVLVAGVMSDSPAQKAGMKAGDIITNLGGKPVNVRFKEEVPIFNQYVASLPVDMPVEAQILRDGKPVKLTLTTEERHKAMDNQHELRSWGICATNITYLMQKEMKLTSQDGVIVTGVLPSGPVGSAKPAMREGDVISKVNDRTIKDVADLRQVTKDIIGDADESVPVLVTFERSRKQYITVVKVGKDEMSEPGAEISKAWLPVDMQVITREIAEAIGMPEATGVRITQVYSSKMPKEGGLKVGDLVLKLDGEPIPADQLGDEEVLPSLIRQYDIGTEVKLDIIRDGKPMVINFKLQASPKPARDFPKYEDENFEFTARDIAFSDIANAQVEEEDTGVYVESVTEGGWAALGGLRAGDVISAIDSAPVPNLNGLKKKMEDLSIKKPEIVVFSVSRGIHTLFVEIWPEWSEL